MASSPTKHSSPTRPNPTDDLNRQISHTNSANIERSRSVQFSAPPSPGSAPKMSRRADVEDSVSPHQLAESSADEITPIFGRERGGSRNYDTAAKLSDNGLRSGSQVGTARSRKSSKTSSTEQQAQAVLEERTRWWRDLVEKYGSVELDNKGSVARDHLALGRFPCTFSFSSLSRHILCNIWQLTRSLHRTHLPRLASHLPRFCLHRHCRHTVVQAKHYNL